MSVDPAGNFAYVANGVAGTIAVYAIARDGSALSAIGGLSVAAGIAPIAMTISD